MEALIISFKFHPGHFSHLVANYKLFDELGLKPCLFINERFSEMDEKNEFRKIFTPTDLKSLKKVETAVFWFPALRNLLEMVRLRFFYRSKIVYVYHEPFDSILNYYRSGFSFIKIVKICLINFFHVFVLLVAHQVILPSKKAYDIYRRKYLFLNRSCYLIPLFFDDELNLSERSKKEYFSYIGTVAADHAFECFIKFIKEALTQFWLPDVKFLIATSSVIPGHIMEILQPHLSSGSLVIYSGRAMKNSEINRHYSSSFLVWNAYHRSMQSGVLPKAFMFGAAVLAVRNSTGDNVDHFGTGVLINDNGNLVEIKNAVEEVAQNITRYETNCREKFLKDFYYRGKISNFEAILEG